MFVEIPIGTNLHSPWLNFWVLPISNNRFFSSRFRWCECPISELYPSSWGCYLSFKLPPRLKQFFSHRTGPKRPDTKKTHLKWLLISHRCGGLQRQVRLPARFYHLSAALKPAVKQDSFFHEKYSQNDRQTIIFVRAKVPSARY